MKSILKYLITIFMRLRYKVDIISKIDLTSEKNGVLLLGNHQSFLDWALLQMAYPRQIRFAINQEYYNIWYLKPLLKSFNTIPIPTKNNKIALQNITDALNNGDIIGMFPEGYLTQNGHIAQFQTDFELILQNTNAKILPFYIRGLWEDRFSKAPKKIQTNKNISVIFGKLMPSNSTPKQIRDEVLRLSLFSWQKYISQLSSIQEMWFDNSNNHFFIADSTGIKFSNNKFKTVTILMAQKLKPLLKNENNIGIIMPSTVAGNFVNMAILTLGKKVVNLNYSSSNESLFYALKITNIKTIITSKQAIEKIKDRGFDLSEVLQKVKVIYLEDMKTKISKLNSLNMFLQILLLPKFILKKLYITPSNINDDAVILFSSGSENLPKAIELTHKNIVGNIKQIRSLLTPNKKDIILGTLPTFHSLGLTVTTLFPLLESVPVVCHPDPRDGYNIGKLAHQYKATILLATATFYRLYTINKKLHPEMLSSIRLCLAGAEKLPNTLREAFKLKFQKEIYEGYGATETSPVVSVNLPNRLRDDYHLQIGVKFGSIGMPIVGTLIKITDPETFEELDTNKEGMILVGGVQVMKGYLNEKQKTSSVIKEIDGIRYYVTGDKGKLDEHGFLSIVDRYSRFAKIGGEAVSLGLVEGSIKKLVSQEILIGLTAIPDPKKGEKIVLLVEGDININELKHSINKSDINHLFIPNTYYKVNEIPKLGSGKTDFKGLKNLAIQLEAKKYTF